MEPDTKSMGVKWIVMVVAVILIGLVAVFYFDRAGTAQALQNLKLVPAPEAFTELYFDHPASLPKAIAAGKPIAFSFVIHNKEGIATSYPYEIYFKYPNGTRMTLANGTALLADGASTTIKISHDFQTTNAQGRVVVDLTDLNQQIDFLLPNTNG